MRAPATFLLLLAYLAFVSLGLPDTVLGVAWPSLRGAFDLSQAGMSAVLVSQVSGYFLSGLVAGRLVGKLGVGGLLAGSSLLVALGLAGYAAAPAWALFFPWAAVIGLGSGAIDAGINGYAARHFPVRHLNWLHAFWSVGATAGPAIMTALIAGGAGWRAGYAVLSAALAAMTAAFFITRSSWNDPAAPPQPAPAGEDGQPPPHAPIADEPLAQVLRRGRVWLQIAIFFCYTGLEAGTGAWCFTVLREARGLSVEAAGALTTVFWGSLTAGRIAMGFVVDRVGADRLLRLATLGALAGATLFAAGGAVGGGAGLVVLGVCLAPLFPTLMARTPARLGAGATAHAVGFQVSAATLGSAVMPSVAGFLAQRIGLGAVGPWLALLALALLALHETLLKVTRVRVAEA
ncbi:MAG: MFS transporter [Anaeromyxobacter sp.]